MYVKIGTEAAQFPEKEYINRIFVELWNCALLLGLSCCYDKSATMFEDLDAAVESQQLCWYFAALAVS